MDYEWGALCRVKVETFDEIAVGESKETVKEPVGELEIVVTIDPVEFAPL